MTTKEYGPVWQTWTMASQTSTPQNDTMSNQARPGKCDERQLMQTARIKCRMSIADVAQHLGCDANTVAAYERGEGVLPHDIKNKVKKLLNF